MGGVATLLFLDPTCTLSYARPQWILVGQLSTAGWLCVDTCNMLVVDVWYGFRKVDPSVFVHHFCVIFCLFVSAERNCGVWHQGVLLVGELSVLPLNVAQFIRYYGYT